MLPTNPTLPGRPALQNVSYFAGADGLDPSSKLPNFPPGFMGSVRIDQTKGITRRDGQRAFIAELTVMESNMPETIRIGGKYSWFQSLKEPGTAYPACISFLYAALGLDSARHKTYIETHIKPAQDSWLNRAANENVLAGSEVRLQTALKKTKANTDFTVHLFAATPKALAEADQAAGIQ